MKAGSGRGSKIVLYQTKSADNQVGGGVSKTKVAQNRPEHILV